MQSQALFPPETFRKTQYSPHVHFGLPMYPSFGSHGVIIPDPPSTRCTPKNKLVNNLLYGCINY